MWVPGIKLTSSNLASCPFTHWAVSSAFIIILVYIVLMVSDDETFSYIYAGCLYVLLRDDYVALCPSLNGGFFYYCYFFSVPDYYQISSLYMFPWFCRLLLNLLVASFSGQNCFFLILSIFLLCFLFGGPFPKILWPIQCHETFIGCFLLKFS